MNTMSLNILRNMMSRKDGQENVDRADKGGKGGWGRGGGPPGLHKASILCILDTRQIDAHKTASIQKKDKTSWGECPACIK